MTHYQVRFLLPHEARRLSELIHDLQDHQKLAGVVEIPDGEAIEQSLFHRTTDGVLVPNNLGTFIAVAVDLNCEDTGNQSNVVGYLMYTQKFNLAHGRQLYINSFFIEEQYRRHGLGRKLIKFMQLHGQLLGIDKFDVPFMKNNMIGQKFYKTFGAYLVDDEYNLIATPVDI